jgi:hypothetical protein
MGGPPGHRDSVDIARHRGAYEGYGPESTTRRPQGRAQGATRPQRRASASASLSGNVARVLGPAIRGPRRPTLSSNDSARQEIGGRCCVRALPGSRRSRRGAQFRITSVSRLRGHGSDVGVGSTGCHDLGDDNRWQDVATASPASATDGSGVCPMRQAPLHRLDCSAHRGHPAGRTKPGCRCCPNERTAVPSGRFFDWPGEPLACAKRGSDLLSQGPSSWAGVRCSAAVRSRPKRTRAGRTAMPRNNGRAATAAQAVSGRQHGSFDLACHSFGCSPVRVRQQFGFPPA